MKLLLIWFCISCIFSCHCAHLDPTASYDVILHQEEDALSGEFSEGSGQYLTSDYDDTVTFEDWFRTTASLGENNVVDESSSEIPQELGLLSELPIMEAELFKDADWMESKLRIEHTPYSALLYQEDEFGLEFLCPGYWLRKDMLLVRGDCWTKDMDLNIEDTVDEVFLKSDLNLMIVHLLPNLSHSEEQEPLHLAIIPELIPGSINDCTLYVLQEDYALFELYSWAIQPLPFKRAKGLCGENHICLRTRASAAYGLDYALLCGQSFAGMLTTDRTKYERVFGKLTLMDLSVAKPWIDQVLEETEGKNEASEEHATTFLSLSLTPMPPAEMNSHDGDGI
ncbi:uncharacterized protein LOC128714098 [Anopheles marshallii]|uniref:uncharacterized protein LOC128714098 n=1 Tax=Anopheles marshallii TaxID=1521116 RepID=UPI00237B4066|nr:uncharacterized protein LOC128714098 [Anopheles marshallii]